MTEKTKARAWRLYDHIVETSTEKDANPWQRTDSDVQFDPDYGTLCKLLGVPLLLGAKPRSGVPALALDVWMSYELRRAGFAEEKVWPRAAVPRVLPSEISALLNGLPKNMSAPLQSRIARRTMTGVNTASANLLGKHYVKQIDVGMSSWQTGPELMISTKRMDSSFGNNAANRVEESYGDARNLRARYPQSALGFFYSMRSTALESDARTADWLIDLLGKLGREHDAYDAVALIIPDWKGSETAGYGPGDEEQEDRIGAAGLRSDTTSELEDVPAIMPSVDVLADIEQLPIVELRRDAVPRNLDPGRFISVMVDKVLVNSPVTYHSEARRRRDVSSQLRTTRLPEHTSHNQVTKPKPGCNTNESTFYD